MRRASCTNACSCVPSLLLLHSTSVLRLDLEQPAVQLLGGADLCDDSHAPVKSAAWIHLFGSHPPVAVPERQHTFVKGQRGTPGPPVM